MWPDDPPPYATLLDAALRPFPINPAEGLEVIGETLPALAAQGSIETGAGTGVRVASGSGATLAGTYRLVIHVVGQPTRDELALRTGSVLRAARVTRWVERRGRQLPVARVVALTPTQHPQPRQGCDIDVAFEPVVPYWLDRVRERRVPVGAVTPVDVAGDADCPLRVRLTAGASAVVDPEIHSASGVARWLGTIPAGGTLDLSALPGERWTRLNGAGAGVRLVGMLPLLRPGQNTLEIKAPGATAVVSWREGWLA